MSDAGTPPPATDPQLDEQPAGDAPANEEEAPAGEAPANEEAPAKEEETPANNDDEQQRDVEKTDVQAADNGAAEKEESPKDDDRVHSDAEVVDSPAHSSDDETAPPPKKFADDDASKPPVVVAGDAGAKSEYPVDIEKMIETFERRDTEALATHFNGVNGFASIVKCDPAVGINSESVGRRQEALGINQLDRREPVTFLEMVIDAFGDRVIQILSVAAIISIIFGLFLPDPYTGEVERGTGWIKGTAIVISVLVVTMTGAIQNYKKAKKFEEMEMEQSIKNCSVLRDGREQTITSTELVVGDIMILETGMELPCDGLLLNCAELRTNESPITGEPDLIEKKPEKDCFLVSGTCVEEGTGTILVAAVGMNSFQGKLKEATQQEGGSDETPLQEHLTALGDNIGEVGLLVAVGMLLALTLKELIVVYALNDRDANAARFLAFVIIAITLIAVAIPEGLPLAVTIALAFSMSAMMEQQCMVRVLASCETMGAATAVCSDKTGTLTTNMMTAVQALLAELEFIIDGYGLDVRGDHVKQYDRNQMETIDTTSENVENFAFSLSINSTARQQKNDDGDLIWVGNKTEAGILSLVLRLGRDYVALRNAVAEEDKKQYPFSSAKKRMTTLVRKDKVVTAHTKGASETILAACDQYVTADGSIASLTDEKRNLFNEIIVNMATQGNRTIGVATKQLDVSEFPDEEPDVQYVFLGVLGIQDPIRPEVPAAVKNCEAAHLSVRMVTGDNINTAKAIGAKCGLYNPDKHLAMTGPEFRKMYTDDKEKLIALLPELRILARSSPTDKYILVGLLQDEHGEVVGVTGDGTNDAPALKLANVGFAMQTGTDIAKGAADMVLLDDNFATVVTAIKWGRSVNDNIKKFLQYQLAINFAGVGLTIIGSLASEESKEPIAPVQLLWLNLIMDTLAALSLATELPEERCLTRLPVYKQAPLITNKMRLFIAAHGGYQFILILLVLFLGHKWFDTQEAKEACTEVGGTYRGTCFTENVTVGGFATNLTRTVCPTALCQQGRKHSTIIFNVFIWFQVFNVINARKIYGEANAFEGLFDRSKIMLVVFIAIIGLQVFAVELGGDALATTGLSWQEWLICVAFGLSEWIIGLPIRIAPLDNYVPTKEEIVEARRLERIEEEKQKEEEAQAAAEAKAAESAKKDSDAEKTGETSQRGSRRQSRVKIQDDGTEHKRRGTFVSGDSSLKRSMSIRKTH